MTERPCVVVTEDDLNAAAGVLIDTDTRKLSIMDVL